MVVRVGKHRHVDPERRYGGRALPAIAQARHLGVLRRDRDAIRQGELEEDTGLVGDARVPRRV